MLNALGIPLIVVVGVFQYVSSSPLSHKSVQLWALGRKGTCTLTFSLWSGALES